MWHIDLPFEGEIASECRKSYEIKDVDNITSNNYNIEQVFDDWYHNTKVNVKQKNIASITYVMLSNITLIAWTCDLGSITALPKCMKPACTDMIKH